MIEYDAYTENQSPKYLSKPKSTLKTHNLVTRMDQNIEKMSKKQLKT